MRKQPRGPRRGRGRWKDNHDPPTPTRAHPIPASPYTRIKERGKTEEGAAQRIHGQLVETQGRIGEGGERISKGRNIKEGIAQPMRDRSPWSGVALAASRMSSEDLVVRRVGGLGRSGIRWSEGADMSAAAG